MLKLIYTPKALEDLQKIRSYVAKQFDNSTAKSGVQAIVSAVRSLVQFPEEGLCLDKMIGSPTDYHYLVVKPNYIFYRVEDDTIKIIRILNEKQDYLQILFGIKSISEEGKNAGAELTSERNMY